MADSPKELWTQVDAKDEKILFGGKELEHFDDSHHFVMDCDVYNACVYLSSDKNRENKIFESKDVQLCIKKAFEQKEDTEVVVKVVRKCYIESITINCEVATKKEHK